jgi:hypothetical protein
MTKFNRVYVPVGLWEEVRAGMWSEYGDKAAATALAKEFTSNHLLYGAWMLKVIREWPFSCENALTDYSLNRKAWVGHAAVAMALGIPEDITRAAWAELTDEQRLLANNQAKRAIELWELAYSESRGVREDVGGQVLLWGYS